MNIHKGISLLGHSTNKYNAPSEIYNSLPDCCLYENENLDKTLNYIL